MEQESIVRYWHAVELLQPQSAPKLKKRSNLYGAFIHDTPLRHLVPPWAPDSIVAGQPLPKKRDWSHTLFAHLYDSRVVADKLREAFGADQGYREPQFRESAVFAAKFTMAGHMVDDSFVLSTEAWMLGRVLAGKDWTAGFELDQKAAADQASALLTGRVTADALRTLTDWVVGFLGLADLFGRAERVVCRFRSQPVKPDKREPEEDPLNSFLLGDLAGVAAAIQHGETSAPLDQYLRRHDPQRRLHVDDDRASLPLVERLMPAAYADSCWPTERHLGLVHSQQLAVNTILSTLAGGQGLLGINGPPGTGKTTLLRDLVAAIITGRADALAQLRRASDGFVSDGREVANDGGKQQASFKLNPALFGFEIVVASSNNGAVENVTLELPQRDKIDASWLPDAEYFAELGELLSGKPAWGMISGALGSKARRTTFVDRYFFGQRPYASTARPDTETDDDDEAIPDDDAQPGQAPGPQGFLAWLNAQVEVNSGRSTEQRQAMWRQAVSDYAAVKEEARKAGADASRISELIRTICQTRKTIADKTGAAGVLERKLADTVARLAHLDAHEGGPAGLALKTSLDTLKQHLTRKPGFWAKLCSLWKAQRDWNAMLALLEAERDLASAEVARIARLARQLDTSRASLEQESAEARRDLLRLQEQDKALTRDATGLATRHRADHLVVWLQSDTIGRGDDIELAEPWQIEGWRQARARVFVQALKLQRTFFELEAARMRTNLFLANALVTGARFQGLSRDAVRSAWASLFMVVPVLSSTFASFARSFGSLRAGDIGWLMVDEAGQAPPQAAVGALWRARRAVLVGDPLQLKPIVTVSDAALEHMRTRYQVDAHWLPNRQSAQTLADEATPWGRLAGPSGSKTWVGLPLVVHRRCDRPMYALANRIAYDGAMVYGTLAPKPEKETRASLPTGWIHVKGTSQGNWVPEEGQALQALLAHLRADGVDARDISVITPFTDVRNNLKRIVGKGMVFGTIHTMQGKEAMVVIMVLGGNTAGAGARNWAVSEPNLLNVAATRAKRRFYVIGDRDDWQNRALFCDVMDLLPLQAIPTRPQETMALPQ
ncbi:ATP-binding protein [Massilia kyonggiensis]|nr:ATP-binding protein [Massilia kyonggiensis]